MNTRYPLIPLKDVLEQYNEYIPAPEPKIYPKLSVKLYGKGVVLDEPTEGTFLKMKKHQIAKSGQVILSEIWGKKGAIGFVPHEGDGALCTSHFFLFNVRYDRIDPGYLQAIFTADYLQDQLDTKAKGSTSYAAVRPKHLLAARIPLPPLDEQRRIVARIEGLAARIEEAQKLRRQAAEGAEALLTASIKRSFDNIPINGQLSDVLLENPRNGWSAKCDNVDTGIPVLTLTAVTGFQYNENEFKRTSEATSPNAHYWLHEDDLLITRSNTPELVGHAAIYNGYPKSCIYPDLMMRLKIDTDKADKNFVLWWLRNPKIREYIISNAKGSSPTMKKINQKIVMDIPYPLSVSTDEQRRIVADLDELQAKIDALKKYQVRTDEELDALLPSVLDRAFRGEF